MGVVCSVRVEVVVLLVTVGHWYVCTGPVVKSKWDDTEEEGEESDKRCDRRAVTASSTH